MMKQFLHFLHISVLSNFILPTFVVKNGYTDISDLHWSDNTGSEGCRSLFYQPSDLA